MIDWDRIERFLGYGKIDAPVVFIGMEEGGPDDPDKLFADLLRRSAFDEIETYAGHSGAIQRTWRVACYLMLRRMGVEAPTVSQLVAYQDNQFAKRGGDVLLTELMPYPNRTLSSWPKIYEARETRADYFQRLLPRRTKLIRDMLASSRRELIIAYGKGHWNAYADIFGIDLNNSNRANFLRYEWMGARVVFCPHFVSRAFNANASLLEFANFALNSVNGDASSASGQARFQGRQSGG